MCGIAGVFDWGSHRGERLAEVQAMLHAQRHRGPDAEGVLDRDGAILGHRRLSILDLSEAGTQPMGNEDGSVQITFNGEIYNYRELYCQLRAHHRFTSQTDTEVLIHGYEEWGMEGLLTRLCGMFAFAMLDTREETQRLFLVRDRLGIKPLYYAQVEDRIYFASETRAIRGLAGVSTEIDSDALLGYLALGSTPAPLTMFRGIRCLPAGHYLEVPAAKPSPRRYWDLRRTLRHPAGDPEAGLKATLQEAVTQHLISDVPLGIFLSGGVDSAGLVALAHRSGQNRLRTLTVTFAEQEFDESAPARSIARHFGTEHQEIRVDAREFMAHAPRILAALDQPTHDGVNTYFVSEAARKAGLTVVLSGLGGDEVFWGYRHYQQLSRSGSSLQRLLGAPAILRRALASAGSAWGAASGRENLRRLEYLRNGLTPGRVYLTMRGFFPPAQIQQLLGLDSRELGAGVDRLLDLMEPAPGDDARTPEAFNYLESQRYLHDQLLRDTDVFSMAHSIEARVPYLDHRVVEAAAAVGASRKVSDAGNKPLLVEAIDSELVSKLSLAPKRGFTFPFQQWMRRHAAELAPLACETTFLDQRTVRDLWKQHADGRLHWSRAWSTVTLAAACRRAV